MASDNLQDTSQDNEEFQSQLDALMKDPSLIQNSLLSVMDMMKDNEEMRKMFGGEMPFATKADLETGLEKLSLAVQDATVAAKAAQEAAIRALKRLMSHEEQAKALEEMIKTRFTALESLMKGGK